MKLIIFRTFISSCQFLREMLLFLKKWLIFVNEAGATNISNRALLWMSIFYLQKLQILPAIHELINTNSRIEIEGKNTAH